MDGISKVGSAILILLLAAGCAEKTAHSVFPDSENENLATCAGAVIPDQYIVEWADGSITVEKGETKEAFIQNFVEPHLKNIERVSHDRKMDLSFDQANQQDARASAVSNDFWGQEMIEADKVWAQGITGEGVIVSVVDTGAQVEHMQLSSRIAINDKEIPSNGVDDDQNGYIDDVNGYDFATNSALMVDEIGHGTHVSGIILGDHSAGYMRGVAPGAKLIPAKFISDQQGGSFGAAIMAIKYSAQRGARIINASWGGRSCDAALRSAIADLAQQDILFVVAAGNSGLNLESNPEYPAAYNLPNQITVGSSDYKDLTSAFSNVSLNLVHLLAPGSDILSLFPSPSLSKLASQNGTSMAAPFVSGGAALLWSARPNASLAQVKAALYSSVDTSTNFPVATRGRLNVHKALEKLSELVP